jgi:hypothetical protein
LLYVSDALEADEMMAMRHHLASGCPACSGYLAEAQATFNSIPMGLDPVMPSAGLKQKLMDRVTAEIEKSDAENRQIPDSLPIRLFRMFVPAAVAAGIAIVGTHALMNSKLTEAERRAQRQEALSRQLLVQQAQEIDSLRQKFQLQTQVVEMLQSPDVKLVHLHSTDEQPKAVANLLWDQKHQRWELLTTGMTPPPPGQTYELWFITASGATAAGTFDVDTRGTGVLRVEIPPDLGALKVAAVTNEKIGGVAQPAGKMQIQGSVE